MPHNTGRTPWQRSARLHEKPQGPEGAPLRLRRLPAEPERRRESRLLRRHDRLTPEKRFQNHKNGIKCARVVRDHGERLVPRLYAHLNPMTFERAVQMEAMLADGLRKRGFIVFGGH